MGETTCNEPGCERPVYAKGKCQLHYQAMRRRLNPRSCSHEGCNEPHYAKGECWNHYRQSRGIGRKEANRSRRDQAYSKSLKGKKRAERYRKKTQVFKRITGIPQIKIALQNQDSLTKLNAALTAGDRGLLSVWSDLRSEQKQAIPKAKN